MDPLTITHLTNKYLAAALRCQHNLALQSKASTNPLSFSQDITTTHRLVETPAKTPSRLIREFINHHE